MKSVGRILALLVCAKSLFSFPIETRQMVIPPAGFATRTNSRHMMNNQFMNIGSKSRHSYIYIDAVSNRTPIATAQCGVNGIIVSSPKIKRVA